MVALASLRGDLGQLLSLRESRRGILRLRGFEASRGWKNKKRMKAGKGERWKEGNKERRKEGKRERATEAKRGKEGGRGKEIERERCKGERGQWVNN